jgi:hydroxymethylpyrimidine pyrophosphatase-like HAD family hydrolase
MRFLALACDYDGTLAADGRVSEAALARLERLGASGRRLILVTGRVLEDLAVNFPPIHFFDRVVAENGAVLYDPATRKERLLAEPPPPRFVQALAERGIGPLGTGRVIVATWHPNATAVLDVIRDLGLDLQVVFNKEAVMVLPAGITKASGLKAALGELGLSAQNVVGVGDAENDHAFLRLCECSVAVSNALPMLKEHADFITERPRSEGVIELIDRLIANDLADVEPRRHQG